MAARHLEAGTDSTTKRGHLLLADLSGFTAFLTASELEHAHDILRELIELIVRRLSAVLPLAEAISRQPSAIPYQGTVSGAAPPTPLSPAPSCRNEG